MLLLVDIMYFVLNSSLSTVPSRLSLVDQELITIPSGTPEFIPSI